MNWLQKVKFAGLSNDNTFFLLDGDLEFFPCLHDQYLTRVFGLSTTEGNAFRFLLPRGRATSTYEGVLIEASAELQPYQREIINQLGLEQIDRPKWEFRDSHYRVSAETAWEVLDDWQSFSPAAERFLSRYAPGLLEVA